MTSDSPSLEARVIELETLVLHLQRDLDLLNGALVEQRDEIASLEKQIAGMEGTIEQALQEPEQRDPLDEKPPHY